MKKQIDTGKLQDSVVFKDNCDWNEVDGYYCIEEVISIPK